MIEVYRLERSEALEHLERLELSLRL